ncbi:MAG: hypothetical protein CMP59_08640 [Flavobacteriales bacterium]|nr:hypothetical protein [Flavobacteriales bacterium]|tara:strand:+ start:3243 stop:3818 length:576 start_codon:yes stop_codon:yes gene_type:complete
MKHLFLASIISLFTTQLNAQEEPVDGYYIDLEGVKHEGKLIYKAITGPPPSSTATVLFYNGIDKAIKLKPEDIQGAKVGEAEYVSIIALDYKREHEEFATIIEDGDLMLYAIPIAEMGAKRTATEKYWYVYAIGMKGEDEIHILGNNKRSRTLFADLVKDKNSSLSAKILDMDNYKYIAKIEELVQEYNGE